MFKRLLFSAHGMVLLQLVFQIVRIGHLVALRGTDLFMAGHVLHLAKIVSIEPVGDHAAADLSGAGHR